MNPADLDFYNTHIKPTLGPSNATGAAELAGNLIASYGAQAVNGLGKLQGQDTNIQPPELGDAGVEALKSIAPAYYSIKNGPVGKAASWLSDRYHEGVNTDADLVSKYLGTPAGGEVAALGEVAPMLIPGPGRAEEAAAPLAARALEHTQAPRAYDNSTMHSLLNEGHAANQNPVWPDTSDPTAEVGSMVNQGGEHNPYGPVVQSIRQSGGATYHPGTGDMPQEGYAVSLHKGREHVMPDEPSADDIHNYIQQNSDAFQKDPDAHFGEWHNPDNGMHYLDVTHVDPDLPSAMAKAKANNQEAIFNLATKEAIPNPDYADPAGVAAPAFADGGEAGMALAPLGELMAKYAPEAQALAEHIQNNGGATYSPVTGDLHTTGTVTATAPAKTVSLDAPPSAEDIHSFLMDNQDTLGSDPSAVLHATSDPSGNHFLHLGKHQPDSVPPETDSEQPDQSLVERYLSPPAIQTPWTPGQQTVANPKRNAFPGVYNDPRQVIADANNKVDPENPLMQRLFGVSRQDLSDLALSRQGNELGVLPSATKNPRGSAAANDVMTPQNAQRLVDVLGEAKDSPDQRLYQGMTGWYSMDPLYQKFVQMFGEDLAPEKYKQFNTLSGMASPGTDVGTEIARGSAANWLQTQGRFNDFMKYGGGKEGGANGDRPEDMLDIPGHMYHQTAQALPMQRYLDAGVTQMKSPKVPLYIHASGVPETGFQTDTPVGDAHWARGVGLADTRGTRTLKGEEIVPGSSVSTPEMQALAPWWRSRVADQVGLSSVPAQALAWGAFSKYTGVKSQIGAPKLEILSTQIGKLAQRLGVSPETARDMVISGKAGAFRDGGHVGEHSLENEVAV